MNSSENSSINARSDRGLQILKEAFSEGEMVLEFQKTDDGIIIIPIGDHVEELERENKALRKQIED